MTLTREHFRVMNGKVTKIWLCAPQEGYREDFPIEQAERMLSLPNPSWKLDDDKFEFENGKIRRKTSR